MSELCKWLHEQLEQVPAIRFPFEVEQLPNNGIYFFYEDGETWGHGGDRLRIVRIGTHKDGNFRSRIGEHFLLNEAKMDFDATKPAPHERSIFRKNIGRVLLARTKDDYIKIWELKFTSKQTRTDFGHKRDIQKEKKVESEVTRILRLNFSFRFIMVDDQIDRMGTKGLESALIGTVAHCKMCRPSSHWLGNDSPKPKIKESGLWLVQHLKANEISQSNRRSVTDAIARTEQWISNGR